MNKHIRFHRLAGTSRFAVAALAAGTALLPAAGQAATQATIHSYSGADGAYPAGPIFVTPKNSSTDPQYAVAASGGTAGFGTLYRIDTAGTVTTLHSFTGADGAYPVGGLWLDSNDNIFGVTSAGGANGLGTIFQYVPYTGTLNTLYSFSGDDGAIPSAGLLGAPGAINGAEYFYGVTSAGGASGYGTVFQYRLAGTFGPAVFTTLHSFTDGSDGSSPNATLALTGGASGVVTLAGTTAAGGDYAYGTVYSVSSAGAFSTLHAFTGSDGASPLGSLLPNGNSSLYYGTTSGGGASGLGTVFQMTPGGVLGTLYSFGGSADGANPLSGLSNDADSDYYGTASNGGSAGLGTAYRIDRNGVLQVLHHFTGGSTDGAYPVAGPNRAWSGYAMYGTTVAGGTAGLGTAYSLDHVLAGPTSLIAKPKPDGILLTWTPVSGYVPQPAGYLVFAGTSPDGEGTTPVKTIYSSSASAAKLTGYAPGQTYYFKVAANYAQPGPSVQYGDLSNEAAADLPVPGTPSDLAASIGSGYVKLSWTPVANTNIVNVYVGTAPGGEPSTPYLSMSHASQLSSVKVTGLVPGSNYYFRINAVDSADGASGALSNEVQADLSLPGTVSDLAATAYSQVVRLHWTPVAGQTKLNVYVGTSPGAESTTPYLTLSGSAVDTANLRGLTVGQTYYFKVAAVSAYGATGSLSNETIATAR